MTNKLYADNVGPSYAYTDGGRLNSRLWARGVETEYAYNNAGQVEVVNYSDATPGMTNSYDRLGRLIGVVNGTNSTTLLYSEAGQLLNETCNGFTVTNSYDALLRRTVLAVDGYTNTVTHYGYDLASRLAGVTRSHLTNPNQGFLDLLPRCFVARRLQIAADMRPPCVSHQAKISQNSQASYL